MLASTPSNGSSTMMRVLRSSIVSTNCSVTIFAATVLQSIFSIAITDNLRMMTVMSSVAFGAIEKSRCLGRSRSC